MNMKKGMVAGLGAIMLLGSAYGINSVYAASSTQTVETKVAGEHVGKRLEMLTQYKDQLHQVNQQQEERLDLKKQAVEKKDQLLDLVVAAKTSGDKEKMKQAKGVKQQLKTLNGELKTLVTQGKDERKTLKEALKTGDGSADFTKVLDTQKQINEKMKEKLSQLDKLIEVLQ